MTNNDYNLIKMFEEENKRLKCSLDYAKTKDKQITDLTNENLKLKYEIKMLTNELDNIYQKER